MAYILIDYENVNEHGLKGVDELIKNDCLVLFYSNSCPMISQENIDHIKNARCKFHAIKLGISRPQALDMYIATFCGQLVAQEVEEIVIVSKDKGFNSIKDYVSMISSKMKIVLAEDIQNSLIHLSSAEDKERRKRIIYKMRKKSIEEECLQININQERIEDIQANLVEAELGDKYEDVCKFYDSVRKEGKKSFYLKALQLYGRKNGIIIYNILKKHIE